jgi:acyl carrier protein
MTPNRLPYLWKIVVAAAVVSLLIMGVREGRKLWLQRQVVVIPSEPIVDAPSGQYADTLARVQEIIAVHTASLPEVATPAMPLVDLGIDPSTRLEVADALETAFRIQLPAEEFAEAATVEDLVRLVLKLQQEKTRP